MVEIIDAQKNWGDPMKINIFIFGRPKQKLKQKALNRSIEASNGHSILWIPNANEIRKDIKSRFYEWYEVSIYELQEKLYHSQGGLSITNYLTHMKILWQEIEQFRHIPGYNCEVPYTWRTHRKQ
jgi:hypothetical protein